MAGVALGVNFRNVWRDGVLYDDDAVKARPETLKRYGDLGKDVAELGLGDAPVSYTHLRSVTQSSRSNIKGKRRSPLA